MIFFKKICQKFGINTSDDIDELYDQVIGDGVYIPNTSYTLRIILDPYTGISYYYITLFDLLTISDTDDKYLKPIKLEDNITMEEINKFTQITGQPFGKYVQTVYY